MGLAHYPAKYLVYHYEGCLSALCCGTWLPGLLSDGGLTVSERLLMPMVESSIRLPGISGTAAARSKMLAHGTSPRSDKLTEQESVGVLEYLRMFSKP